MKCAQIHFDMLCGVDVYTKLDTKIIDYFDIKNKEDMVNKINKYLND